MTCQATTRCEKLVENQSEDCLTLQKVAQNNEGKNLKRRGDDSILNERSDTKQMRKTDSNSDAVLEEEKQLQSVMQSIKEEEEFDAKQYEYGEYTQNEVKITKQINELMAEIKKQADDLELILDMDNEKVLVTGFEKKIQQIVKFIEEKEREIEKKAALNPPSITTAAKIGEKEDYIQKEISISAFQRACQKDIENKAKELDLIIDFGYDLILVTGFQENIGQLKEYLCEVESKQKKSLYPKYWDFHDITAFCMVTIAPETQEYKEIEKLFFASMQGQKFIKLERIQNKYLMEHYIINVQKRMELKTDNKEINRMLLFHGTRNNKPELIYKNFDVGFDLQYAAQGHYGKGLYFAVKANYSHTSFVHKTPNGTCQLLIADVFIGKAHNSEKGNFIKAPNGYDSISANDEFYVLYNNFHSYPLYLLEYQ